MATPAPHPNVPGRRYAPDMRAADDATHRAGRAAGRRGEGRDANPYGGIDLRLAERWLAGWELGRRDRERRPGAYDPFPLGTCALPGCGREIAWNPALGAAENRRRDHCTDEHEHEHRRLRGAERMRALRLRRAAGVSARPPGRPKTETRRPARPGRPGAAGADNCEAEVAALRAAWEPLGFDVRPRILEESVALRKSGERGVLRRVVSDLVGGLPPGVSWAEVQRRRRRLEAKAAAAARGAVRAAGCGEA